MELPRWLVIGMLTSSVLAVLAAAGWLLWPAIHIYSVQRASLDGSGAPFWWPTSWRNELDPIQKMVKCIKEEQGVEDVGGRFSFAPSVVEGFAQKVKDVGADEPAVGVLVIFLEDEKQTNGSRCLAATALGMFGPKAADAVPALIRVLQATNEDVPSYRRLPYSERTTVKISSGVMLRWAAAYALATIGPKAKDAIPALKQAAADPDSLVAQTALNALKSIDPAISRPQTP